MFHWWVSAFATPAVVLTPPPPACQPTFVDIGLTGDVMVHGMQLKAAKQPDGSYSMDGVFDPIAPVLSAPDIMLANLETNIAGEDLEYTGYPRFNSPPTVLEELKGARVDHLQTANNHCLDRNLKGLTRTLHNVEKFGFTHSGTYASALARQTPWQLLEFEGGLQVAVLGYTYGTESPMPDEFWWVAYFKQQTVELDILAARAAGADLVIVGVHWGREYRPAPEPFQVDLAKEWVEAGADIIWGHHPHVIQPVEVIRRDDRDALVFYSFGNFVSNQRDFPKYGGAVATVRVGHCPAGAWIEDLRLQPTWVDDRRDDRTLEFRVHPVPSTPVQCVGDQLSAEDCSLIFTYRAHAEALLPVERFGSLPKAASPRPLHLWPWRFQYVE